jgi:hypothetical protein
MQKNASIFLSVLVALLSILAAFGLFVFFIPLVLIACAALISDVMLLVDSRKRHKSAVLLLVLIGVVVVSLIAPFYMLSQFSTPF